MLKIKLVIFDLDGVLIDSRMIHFEALNRALASMAYDEITLEEHLSTYDGLPTTRKLKLLTERIGLLPEEYDEVWKRKQQNTVKLFDSKIKRDDEIVAMFDHLRTAGVKVAIASNSIGVTLFKAISSLGVSVDGVASNEDVKNPKPHPEMYWRLMTQFKVLPKETLIVEDSHIGRQAAIDSGAHLLPVENRADLTMDKLRQAIKEADVMGHLSAKVPWRDKKLNVVVPMAGAGSRFEKAGYTFPKPLIEIHGKPMIQVVCENLNIEANYIFLCQEHHIKKYNLNYLLPLIKSGCTIVPIYGMTEGAACTVLKARHFVDNDNPLLIVNSDQFVEWNSNEVMYAFTADQIDGGIVTFESLHPKWSYAKLGDDGFVTEVAEKKVISNHATVGFYYWRHGADFVSAASEMIKANDRMNGEFYVAPTINYALKNGKKFRIKKIDKMWGLGTPEDLQYFLEHHKE